ncbi:spore germination protein GerPE [Bacillus sp. EAC]|uniref:spore germination protein GerPE n=1 Tax=Bacillus sp. EAC TaxID=1978338 RepID=UPI001154FBFE|nr:spore germination protein GerPE [Bacillus sp. EAC]
MFKIDPRFRLAAVERFDVNSTLFSSILQFGDVFSINSESNALALHQEGKIIANPERDVFEIYPVYKVVPTHDPYVPIVNLNRVNINPTIQVGYITFNGISAASVSLIGSVHSASMLSRVHQIRRFEKETQIQYQSHSSATSTPIHEEYITGATGTPTIQS